MKKIIQRIEKDVQNKIDSMMEEEKEKAEKIREEIEQEKQRRLNEIEKEKEREIKTLKNRIISQAELKARKKRLDVREKMIEKVFEKSRERLRKMEPKEYSEYLKEAIKRAKDLLEGEVKVHCPKESEESVRDTVAGIDSDLEVIGDLKSIGGIKATSDRGASIDLTFEANLKRKKKDLRKEISDILFTEEE